MADGILPEQPAFGGKRQRMLLEGKVALITGSARGIGRSIAGVFAGEGARAIVTGRDMERLTRAADEIRAGGGEAEAFVLDVTRQDDAVRVVEQVIGKWGRIDLLVQQCRRLNL